MSYHEQIKAIADAAEQQAAELLAQRTNLAAMCQRVEQERQHIAAFRDVCVDQINNLEQMCAKLQQTAVQAIDAIDAMIDQPQNKPELRAVE